MVTRWCLTSCFALPFLAHAADKFPFEELEQKNASASPRYDYVGYGATATGAGTSWLYNSILKTMFDETMIGTSVFVAKPTLLVIVNGEAMSNGTAIGRHEHTDTFTSNGHNPLWMTTSSHIVTETIPPHVIETETTTQGLPSSTTTTTHKVIVSPTTKTEHHYVYPTTETEHHTETESTTATHLTHTTHTKVSTETTTATHVSVSHTTHQETKTHKETTTATEKKTDTTTMIVMPTTKSHTTTESRTSTHTQTATSSHTVTHVSTRTESATNTKTVVIESSHVTSASVTTRTLNRRDLAAALTKTWGTPSVEDVYLTKNVDPVHPATTTRTETVLEGQETPIGNHVKRDTAALTVKTVTQVNGPYRSNTWSDGPNHPKPTCCKMKSAAVGLRVPFLAERMPGRRKHKSHRPAVKPRPMDIPLPVPGLEEPHPVPPTANDDLVKRDIPLPVPGSEKPRPVPPKSNGGLVKRDNMAEQASLNHPDNFYCSAPSKAPWVDRALQGIDYLSKMPSDRPICLDECQPSYAQKHTCIWDNAQPKNMTDNFQCVSTRVSCSYGVAIYAVNCNTVQSLCTNAHFIADRARTVLSTCCESETRSCLDEQWATKNHQKSGGLWKHPTDEWYVDVRYTDGIGRSC